MQAKIILRHVGAPAAHFVNLLMAVGNNVNARADSISPRGKGANKKRIAASAKVFQQRWRFTHIDDNDFFIAVVVQIAYGQTARRMNVGYTRPALRRQIKKLTVAAVPVQEARLLVLFGGAAGIHFG